jgi:hypothetical protein
MSQFPLRPIPFGQARTFFIRSGAPLDSILVTGKVLGRDFERPLEAAPAEDAPIKELFAYEMLSSMEIEGGKGMLPDKMIRVSLESGILCRYTAFVGVGESESKARLPEPEIEAEEMPVYNPARDGPERGTSAHQRLTRCHREHCSLEAEEGGAEIIPVVKTYDEERLQRLRRMLEGSHHHHHRIAKGRSSCHRAAHAGSGALGKERTGELWACAAASHRYVEKRDLLTPLRGKVQLELAAASAAEASRALLALDDKEARRRAKAPQVLDCSFPLYVRIVQLQQINGSWKDCAALARLCEIDVKVPEKYESRKDGTLLFATSFALALLRTKCRADKTAWKLVEKKALAWIGGEGEEMVGEAMKLL